MRSRAVRQPAQRSPRWVASLLRMRFASQFLLFAFLLPLVSHAIWWLAHDHPRSFVEADWSSAGVLPPAEQVPEAVVHVLAGRAGRWKGIFAHHTWIVIKPKGASRYTRFDVVGWGQPVRIDGYAADGRWYGDTPRILTTLTGEAAERAIPRIREAVASYPFSSAGSYGVWPGPNSNTFVAYVARAVPELASALLPTAIGKDYVRWPRFIGLTPSGTGLQVSFGGMIGLSVGWVEGLELNLLGAVAGIDVRRPALKVPGWGRLGMPAG
jgi:uncharacterized protein DUF3750